MAERVELQSLVYSFGVDTKPMEEGTRKALDVIKRGSQELEHTVADSAKRIWQAFSQDPAKAVEAVADSVENAIKKLGFAGQVAAGVLAGVAAASAEATKVAEAAQQLINTSQTLAVSTTQLQEFDHAATAAGVPVDTFRAAILQANQALAQFKDGTASDAIKKAFADFGISAEQAKSANNIGDIWDRLLEGADRLPDAKRSQDAVTLGLGSALPVINQGSAAYRQLTADLHALGGVMDADVIAKNAAAARSLNSTADIIKRQFAGAFADLSPWVARTTDDILKLTSRIAEFVRAVVDSIPALAHWSTYFKLFGYLSHDDFKGAGEFFASLPQQGRAELAATAVKNPATATYEAQARRDPVATHPRTPNKPSAAGDGIGLEKAVLEAYDQAQKQLLDAITALTGNLEQRAQFEREAVDAELKKQLDALAEEQKRVDADKSLTAAKKRELDATIAVAKLLDEETAEAKKQLATLKATQERQTLDLTLAQQLGAYQDDILKAQASIAKTLEQRQALELQILKDEQARAFDKQKLDLAQQVQTGKLTQAQADAQLNGLRGSQGAQLGALQDQQRRDANPLYAFGNPVGDSLGKDAQTLEVGGVQKFGQALTEVITHTKTLKAAFHDMAQGILQDLTQLAVKRAIEQPLANALFGAQGGAAGEQTSPLSGFLGAAFKGVGGFLGGFFADGGSPPVGKPSVVGEKGPELFVPKTAGTIIPNANLSTLGGAPRTAVSQTTVNQAIHLHMEGALMTDEFAGSILRQAGSQAAAYAQQAGSAAFAAAQRAAPSWSDQNSYERG